MAMKKTAQRDKNYGLTKVNSVAALDRTQNKLM